MTKRQLLWLCLLLSVTFSRATTLAQTTTTNPILFVTQVPIPADFTTIGSTFGNHLGNPQAVARGGDLWIRYPDGTTKNLTAAAGYGVDGYQDANSIAVRDPAVHWSGTKAIFSMIIGSPGQYEYDAFYWQLYEITGLDSADSPSITHVPNQPANFNNISPTYLSDDTIAFTSDRPRNGARHLYPQLDEYEEAPTVSGLWRLDPATGALNLFDHAPSGVFEPFVDSFGRIIFTRWDHLQRDQQADADNAAEAAGNPCIYCTYDWTSESADATKLTTRSEIFPEPRTAPAGSTLNDHRFNHFFPWMVNQDGSELETLNHIGRHELHFYFNRSFNNDNALTEFIDATSGRTNPNSILNFFQISEDPTQSGRYIGIDAPEFQTHAAGQIVAMQAAPTDNADEIVVEYVTHPDTADVAENPSADHSGLYRDPIVLADGTLVAVHTAETRADENDGSFTHPQSRYDFHLKTLTQSGAVWVADQLLTPSISKTVTYYDPDSFITYSGALWQLQPVEVVARTTPPATSEPALPAPEQSIVDSSGVNWANFKAYLEANDLAVVVSRDVTTRDDADVQQPYNLRVPNGVQTINGTGMLYDVSFMQFYQADQLRGIGDDAGRRVVARAMHDVPNADGTGRVALGLDGSMAAFVSAERALTWQLTDANGAGVVRERYWLTFQPGEVRVCTSCHGLNATDQAGATIPTNPPQALADLLTYWQTDICAQQPTPTGCATTPTAVTLQQTETQDNTLVLALSIGLIGVLLIGGGYIKLR